MRLHVSDDIRSLFPALRIGVLIGRGVDNAQPPEAALALLRREGAAVAGSLHLDGLGAIDEIAAWREAYKLLGKKLKGKKASAEAIIESVLESRLPGSISPVVDVYRAAQLRWRLPLGGYDLSKVTGDLHLRRSPGGESFVTLSGASETTDPNEVVYADERHVLTRRWNWRDGSAAMIDPTTTDIVLMSEAPSDKVPAASLSGTLEFLTEHLTACCGGTYESRILSFTDNADAEL